MKDLLNTRMRDDHFHFLLLCFLFLLLLNCIVEVWNSQNYRVNGQMRLLMDLVLRNLEGLNHEGTMEHCYFFLEVVVASSSWLQDRLRRLALGLWTAWLGFVFEGWPHVDFGMVMMHSLAQQHFIFYFQNLIFYCLVYKFLNFLGKS